MHLFIFTHKNLYFLKQFFVFFFSKKHLTNNIVTAATYFLSSSLFYISFQKAERESPSLLLFPKKKKNVHFVLGSFSLLDKCMNHHFIFGLITQSLR